MTNNQMCEMVTLRRTNKKKNERIEELERMLVRASNKLESYDGTEFFVAKIDMVLEGAE
jgi:hypothetical protein